MTRFSLCSFTILLVLPVAPVWAQSLEVTIQNGKRDLGILPVRVPLQWPKDLKATNTVNVEVGKGGPIRTGQIVEPNFVSGAIKADEGKVRKDLIFLNNDLKAGQVAVLKIDPVTQPVTQAAGLSWKDQPNDFAEVVAVSGDGKSTPIMRYMYKTYDTTNAETRNKSYKVFHHLYNPAGTRFVTNGGHTDPGANDKNLTFPHHRGLMFGVNKCSYDGKTADTWHCTGGTHVSHAKTLFQNAGPLLAEHRVLLNWHGQKDDVFAEEERQMSVYPIQSKELQGTLVDFTTRLTPKVAKVKLDGDPQHAGFQFRAANDVAKKTAKETYYLRPDGKGDAGKTRNWPGDKALTTNLPWNVLSFVLDGKRYSVAYIDHPNNPGEKRYSERDYGRFGCYFEYNLTPETPLVLNHRIWLQEGEMTPAQVEALQAAFIDPPRVVTK